VLSVPSFKIWGGGALLHFSVTFCCLTMAFRGCPRKHYSINVNAFCCIFEQCLSSDRCRKVGYRMTCRTRKKYFSECGAP